MNTSSFASAVNVSSNGISLIEFLYFTYFSPPGFHPRKKTKKQMMSRPKSKRSTGFRSIRSFLVISMQTSATTFATASGLAGAPVLYDRGLRLHSFKRKIDETFSSNV